MNADRHILSRGFVATLAALLVVLVAASTASAVTGHRYSRSIGSGTLSGVGGGVVRTANSDLYAVDTATLKVEHFNEAGDELDSFDVSGDVASPSFLARNATNGDLYVGGTDANGAPAVVRYTAGGTTPTPIDLTQGGGVTAITGIAVDSQGRLYVGDGDSKTVKVYLSNGTLTTTFDGAVNGRPAFSGVGPIAVDRNNNLYVVEPYVGVYRYTALGATYTRTYTTDQARGLAVDPANDDVYVLDSPDGNRFGITRFLTGGTRQERFADLDSAGSYSAISVDGTNHSVFVGNPLGPLVDVFITFTAPDVTTATPATNVTARTAGVSGTVNPRQRNTDSVFEYGTTTDYGQQTTSKPAGAGNANVQVNDSLAGLLPNTTYHYRLKATNSQGSNLGEDRTFTTLAAPPDVVTGEATAVTRESATLNATVNPNNTGGSAHFEYGTTAAYGKETGEIENLYGSDPIPLVQGIQGLQPETTYHYRIVADNGVGSPTEGDDRTFTTPPALPVASSGQTAGVAGGSAQLSGSVDTQGLAGTVSFLVTARNSTYSGVTPGVALPAADGARSVSASISGLPAGGVFDVRVRVETSTATVFSEPSTFSTAAPPAPVAPAPFVLAPYPAAPVLPSNRFTASSSVKGSVATVKVKVPARGSVSLSGGKRVGKASAKPTKAGTVSLKVKLSKSGRAALRKAKSKRLRVKLAVGYRPTGGTLRKTSRTVTFRR